MACYYTCRAAVQVSHAESEVRVACQGRLVCYYTLSYAVVVASVAKIGGTMA